MRHSDSVRIVHLYKKPLVGDYDEQPFAHCHAFLDTANLNGVVEIVALEPGTTVAESLHEYIAKHNVSYLVLGLNGTGLTDNTCADKREPGDEGDEMLENPVGRVTAAMLFSPRCTLCICP